MAEADTRLVMPIDMDEGAARASTRKLQVLAQRDALALTIYDPNAGQWASLKQAPNFYD